MASNGGGGRRIETSDGAPLPLARFQSLTYALANADLVALYFAASWCPMSTPVTRELELSFEQNAGPGTLLPPGDAGIDDRENRWPLALVYVSSDRNEEEMQKYARDGWITVPYTSGDRNDIKRHFRVCAKREMDELGFERRMEIPSLIVLDGETHGVLTTDGVGDVKEYGGEGALEHWVELRHLVRALEDKYERVEEEKHRKLEPQPQPRII